MYLWARWDRRRCVFWVQIRPPRPPVLEIPANRAREDGAVKTRTLLILALVTGLLIVAAGVAQIFLAR